MTGRRWRAIGIAAAVAGMALVVPFLFRPASAGTAGSDGGGWAHAGVPPGSSAPYRASTAAAPRVFATSTPVSGIDVSSHDHSYYDIDWASVAASGVKFAYVKATEGTASNPYYNPFYASDYQSAKNNGLYAGAYAFGRPDLGDPVGQADYFIDNSLWTSDSQTLIPFLDIEWPYGALKLPACWNLTPTQMSAWIHGFVDRVEARIGRKPMIYTAANWWNPCTGYDPSFGGYPLDVAGYGDTPPPLPAGWNNFTFWQYAAGMPSQPGNYDRDVFNGDLAGLAALAGGTPPTVLSLRAYANSRYVSADRAGASPLIANRAWLGAWEQFDQVDLGNGQIALRSHANGRFVSADNAGTSALIANRTMAGAWETFRLIHNLDGSVSLRAMVNGRYVTAESGGTQPLIANRSSIGAWEKFDQVAPPKVISLRAQANGQVVSADGWQGYRLIANRGTAGPWEQFDAVDYGNGYLSLHAHANGSFVSADAGGSAPLVANRSLAGAWESFQLVHNPDGTVSLRAVANGRYVSAENAGSSFLIANRTTVGSWEKFELIG